MSIKVIMTWDIHPGREQEYFEFVVRTFMPRVTEMGLEMNDAWVTIYGEHPQILVGAEVNTLQKAIQITQSEEWIHLNDKLQEYVDNYTFKLAPLKGAFQF
jgi:hypothetical protein